MWAKEVEAQIMSLLMESDGSNKIKRGNCLAFSLLHKQEIIIVLYERKGIA